MNIAYRFWIYPTEEQKILLGKTFGCCRFLYNQMLNDKIQEYKKTKKMLKNTPAMYKKAYPFLKEVDSLALEMCIRDRCYAQHQVSKGMNIKTIENNWSTVIKGQ